MSERSRSDDDADRDAPGGLTAREFAALPAYVQALLDPAAYPHAPDRVELVQTHISYVFLAGDLVYKTKKPVNFGFIDQVAPERREAHCHAEVELNRRLAPVGRQNVTRPTGTRDGGRPGSGGGAPSSCRPPYSCVPWDGKTSCGPPILMMQTS